MEDSRTYDIFKREQDNTTVRVETVKGIDEAQKALKQLSQDSSGEFFVFDPISNKIIDPFNFPSNAKDPFAP